MPQLQGVLGEAVVGYREPAATKQTAYSRLSQRVNKMEIISLNYISPIEALSIIAPIYKFYNIII